MKVIIAGSRTIGVDDKGNQSSDISIIDNALSKTNLEPTEIVSGTARGVDTLGELWAKQKQLPIKRFPADWLALGKRAGFVRNTLMAKYADTLLAIWDGKSHGTMHMISEMKRLNKPVYLVRYG